MCKSRRDGFWWRWWSVLCLALVLCFFTIGAEAQDSPLLLPDSALIFKPTGPLEEFVLQTLRPSLELALSSSRSTDERLNELQQQIERDRTERQQEQIDWQMALAALSDQADQLRSFFKGLSERLTSFSGDEEQQYQQALEGLDGIQKRAAALEQQNLWLKIGCGALAVLALGLGTWAAVK